MALLDSRIITAFLLLSFCGPLQAENAVRLAVDGDRITAGAVASVVAAWSAIPEDTVLGYAPLPGVERRITRGQLARWAEREGLTADQSNWPEALVVTRRMVSLSSEAVEQILGQYIAAVRGTQLTDVAVALVGYSPIRIPAGEIEFSVELLEDSAASAWLFDFGWSDASGRNGSVRLRARVEVPNDDAAPPARQAALVPVFQQPRRGEAATVRRGAALTLVAKNGPVSLHVPGKAAEAGRVGDWIRCENLESGRTVRARLTSAKQAEVMLP